jgi:hypothetical protein
MFFGLLMNLSGTLAKLLQSIGIFSKGLMKGGLLGGVQALTQSMKYLSLEEIDAAIAAKQLGTATMSANDAFRQQVGAAEGARVAVKNLGDTYQYLIARMAEAAGLSKVTLGAPGAALKTAGLLSKANPYLAAGTAVLGGLQTIVGAIGLARSKRPEGYKETPEMARAIGEAEQAAQYGLGAQQIALANQQAREAQNTQLFNARSMAGGNLSRSIFGANTYNRLMAGNQLAAQDFAAQQQKVGIRNQLYGTRQRLADANTQLAQQNYARQQEAYGGAMRSGLTNLGSFFNLNQALNYNPTA